MTEIARLQIAVDSSGARNATREVENLGRAGDRTEQRYKRLGQAIGAALTGVAVQRAFSAVIRNTIEQERVTAQLEATLRSTGRFTPQLSKALQDYASELQSVTTFGDEAIIGAQSLLLTFTQIGGETFPRATKAILDLSTSMNIDLKSATVQVGKALNDPIRGINALTRSGIQFTDAQKSLIEELVETNQVAEAQAIILGELETQFGGSAEAARNTLGGAISALKNSFGDLLEGDTGGDGVRGATAAINQLTDQLNSPRTKEGFAAVTGFIIDIATEAVKTIAFLGDLISRFRDVQEIAGAARAQTSGGLDDRLLNDRIAQIQSRIGELRDREGAIINFRLNPDQRDEGFRAQARAVGERLNDENEINFLLKERQRLVRENTLRLSIDQGLSPFFEDDGAASSVARQLGTNPGTDPDPDPKGGGGRAAALRDLRAEEERLLEQIRRNDEARTAASTRFLADLESIEANLSGPLAVAELDRARRLQEINDVLDDGLISEAAAARARDAAEESYRRTAEAIEAQLTPAQRLIEDLEFELSLLGLTNVERQKAIALRFAEADAASEQGQAIGDLIEKLERESETVRALDDIRQASDKTFLSIIDRSKSAKDAVISFIDSLLVQAQRAAAANLTESIFGEQGTSGGGIFGSLLSGFFGNRSSGGPVMAGVPYRVNEFSGSGADREVFIPERNGRVEPQRQGRGMAVTNNFTFSGDVDRRTQQQMANEVERSTRRAAGRMR